MKDPQPSDARPFATVADLVVDIAREIRLRSAVAAPGVPLNQTNSQVMRFVHAHPGSTASRIAAGAALKRANVSAALGELRDLGYVVTRRDERDGRSVRVDPTPLADETIGDLRESWAALLEKAWNAASAVSETTTVDGARAGLERLAAGLEATRTT